MRVSSLLMKIRILALVALGVAPLTIALFSKNQSFSSLPGYGLIADFFGARPSPPTGLTAPLRDRPRLLWTLPVVLLAFCTAPGAYIVFYVGVWLAGLRGAAPP